MTRRARPRFLAVLLVITLLTAGCLAGESGDGGDDGADGSAAAPADWAARALPHGDDHDHRDAAQHADLSTPNFDVLGWDPLETEQHGATSGGYFCGEATDDGERRLAFVHSFTTDVAFVVADVTDAANPQVLGELVLPRTHVYDIAATPDGSKVVLATSRPDQPDGGPVGVNAHLADVAEPVFRDACTGETRPVTSLVEGPESEAPYAAGVVLVDVADPANPVIADYRSQPVLGAHSIFATTLEGTDIVLASTTNLAHPGSYFVFYTVSDTPAGMKLVTESTYRPTPGAEESAPLNGHVDGWIADHPKDGRRLAYLADWNGGLVILDVSNLKAPQELGRWTNFEGEGGVDYTANSGSVHGAWPLPDLWDGKHYTLIGQEVVTRPRDTPTGVIFVMDTTDPANPKPVSGWTLPVDVEWGGDLQFSTHYFRVHDRTLFVSMYHGGVWAVDLTDVTAPRSAGVFVPDRAANLSEAGSGFGDWTPTVLDLEVYPDGTIVVWDGPSGVYTVRFNPLQPAPAVAEWPIELAANGME